MRINENSGMNAQPLNVGFNQNMDPESKSLQNQIANAQNQLQTLSANHEMSDEEKAKKRQEIQKQIVELNNQLRQHQIEMRREQQGKRTDGDEMLGVQQREPVKESGQTAGMSSASMQAIISADSAAEQASRQENVSTKLKGRARVLEGELNLTKSASVAEAKKGELESLEDKNATVSGTQVNILNNAVQKMKKVIREEDQKDSSSGEGEKKGVKESDKALSVFADPNKTDAYKKGKMFSGMDIHI